MVVSYGGHTGFGQELRNGHSKGNIHGNGQGILRNEHFNPKFFTKFAELRFKMILKSLNMFCQLRFTFLCSEAGLVKFKDLRVLKMGFWLQK